MLMLLLGAARSEIERLPLSSVALGTRIVSVRAVRAASVGCRLLLGADRRLESDETLALVGVALAGMAPTLTDCRYHQTTNRERGGMREEGRKGGREE